MVKSFFIGFLVGVLGIGCLWFFAGRPDIKRVRKDLDGVNGAYEQVQRTLDTVSIDASGLTGDIASINTEAGKADNRLDILIGDNKNNTDELRFVSGKIDELEQLNIGLIRLGRDFGNDSFNLRRFSEEYGIKE